MRLHQFSSADEIQLSLLETLIKEGSPVSVRQMNTLEIYPIGFELTNPRARCLTNKSRKWSLPLAVGEFAWHFSGSNDVNFISYYAKQWRNFSEDGKVIKESCYGYKIFEKTKNDISQWDNIIRLLSEDSATRRAVLSLYDSANDFGAFSKDVSCICTIQFLIRENKLDAITHMRSNDIILGLPYDLFLVTMLQEYLANTLSVELGSYYHFANSLHLYERHFNLAQNILKADYIKYEMPLMTNLEQLPIFLKSEEAIRNGQKLSTNEVELGDYWKDLLSILNAFHSTKVAPGAENDVNINPHYSEFLEMLKPAII